MSHFLCITEKCRAALYREQRSQETPNSALITTEKTQQSFWLDDSALCLVGQSFFSYLIKGKVRGWEKGGMVGVFSGVFIISLPYGIDPIIRLYHNKVVKIWSSSFAVQKFSKTYEEHLEIRLF